MKNLSDMMKKAQEMQAKMASMQDELEHETSVGEAGGGMVRVTLNGKGDMKAVYIDPALFSREDKDVLEDLIVAAHSSAKARVADLAQEKMKEMTGGLSLPPGFKMPF